MSPYLGLAFERPVVLVGLNKPMAATQLRVYALSICVDYERFASPEKT